MELGKRHRRAPNDEAACVIAPERKHPVFRGRWAWLGRLGKAPVVTAPPPPGSGLEGVAVTAALRRVQEVPLPPLRSANEELPRVVQTWVKTWRRHNRTPTKAEAEAPASAQHPPSEIYQVAKTNNYNL